MHRRDADVIAVTVLDAVQVRRCRVDREVEVDHPLVGAFARAEHHPMLTERDGLAIAVGGAMADGQQQNGLRPGRTMDDSSRWGKR